METQTDDLDLITTKAKLSTLQGSYLKTLNFAKREEVELSGRARFYKLRTKWSWALLVWITLILLLDAAIDHLVGTGYWNFYKYPLLIYEIIFANQAQIVGMGYIVVKFLFPRYSLKEARMYESMTTD